MLQWYKRGTAYDTLVRNRDTSMILFEGYSRCIIGWNPLIISWYR